MEGQVDLLLCFMDSTGPAFLDHGVTDLIARPRFYWTTATIPRRQNNDRSSCMQPQVSILVLGVGGRFTSLLHGLNWTCISGPWGNRPYRTTALLLENSNNPTLATQFRVSDEERRSCFCLLQVHLRFVTVNSYTPRAVSASSSDRRALGTWQVQVVTRVAETRVRALSTILLLHHSPQSLQLDEVHSNTPSFSGVAASSLRSTVKVANGGMP
ncbi:hypothetical protein B566_EDAN017970 [Ephemera danica]|nr:hypothetical protein B566_EDAN017970 [Ephemera danica]